MNQNIDFSAMPSSYVVCWHHDCPLKDNCLRHLGASHVPTDCRTVQSVNLNLVRPEKGQCALQRPVRFIRNAWGLRHIYDNVPHSKYDAIHSRIHLALKNSTYYDYYNERKPMSPEVQEYIQRVFRENGITEPVIFRRYEDAVDW